MIPTFEFPPLDQSKLRTDQMFVIGEPVLRKPANAEKCMITVPLNYLALGQDIATQGITEDDEHAMISEEYWDIAYTLRNIGIDYHFLHAHAEHIDSHMVMLMVHLLGVRGISFYSQVPGNMTMYPRDMMVDFGSRVFINPDANLSPQIDRFAVSVLGEGGSVLKSGDKVMVPGPLGYGESRKKYQREIGKIPDSFRVGNLPWPLSVEIDNTGRVGEPFPNSHLDRVSALLHGQDGKNYLLVSQSYYESSHSPWRSYSNHIRQACRSAGLQLEVVRDGLVYGLNMVQFEDGSVMMSAGDPNLRQLVGEIIGPEKVNTTQRPIVAYPTMRFAGIRCLTLEAPMRLFKPNFR